MKYMGSKARHAKEILKVIEPYRKEGQVWVEPFVGGANMIDKVTGPRIGADINPYLIDLYNSLQLGWVPPKTLSEAEYNAIKNNKDNYPMYLVAYVGFACSYGAKWFGGYCRSKKEARDYLGEAFRNVTSQVGGLIGVEFVFSEGYDDVPLPSQSLIYCDPPYAGTTKYKDDFDSEKFWQWCREKYFEGHTVFVSEYNAPHDWVPIWEKTVNSSLGKDTGSKKATEKLFAFMPQLLRDGLPEGWL